MTEEILEILAREIPDAEWVWLEDAANAIHAYVIETYGPPF